MVVGREKFSDSLSTAINWHNGMKIPFVISEIFSISVCVVAGWRLETFSSPECVSAFSSLRLGCLCFERGA
jgi:hypothetical protein